jgi:hypothetical protein
MVYLPYIYKKEYIQKMAPSSAVFCEAAPGSLASLLYGMKRLIAIRGGDNCYYQFRI